MATDADAVFDRVAVVEHVIKSTLFRRNDDSPLLILGMPPDNDLTRDRLLAEESEKIGERAPIQRVAERQCGKSHAQSDETGAEPSKSTNHFPNLSRRIR